MIEFKNVSLNFNGKAVFSNLSFAISGGDKVVVLGKSGLGKSSLFSLILGFVQPDSGTVLFDGICVDEKSVWDVRRKIAFVDQDVSVGAGKLSEWLVFVSGFKSNSSADFGQKKVEELMNFFEMGHDLLDKDVSELSGGERQRIAIVVSVLLGRKVFLLDEVTSALDRNLKEKVAEFVFREKDWTVIVISHDNIWFNNTSVKIFDLEAGKWGR